MKRNKLIVPLLALMLCMGALFFTTPAYASDGAADTATEPEPLSVNGVWLEGETLNIEVTDKQTGVHQTLEVSLREYAGNSEYVSVQAVDKNGNKSNTIQFKNPLYEPDAAPTPSASAEPGQSESGVPDGSKPLTPDGTGTVTDNVTDGDGKEFFTITTEDGNVFYMVIDRQRESENVYLLNTVTEDDLAALAEKSGDDSGGASQSGIPSQTSPAPSEPPATTSPEPEPSESPAANDGGNNNSTIIFIIIAAAVAGIAGYYFKIIRPKKNAADSGDEYEEDYNDESYADTGEEGEDE